MLQYVNQTVCTTKATKYTNTDLYKLMVYISMWGDDTKMLTEKIIDHCCCSS